MSAENKSNEDRVTNIETQVSIIPELEINLVDSEDIEGQSKSGVKSTAGYFQDKNSEQNSTQLDSGQVNLEPAEPKVKQQQEDPVEELVQDKEHEGENVDDSIQGRTIVDKEFDSGINESIVDVGDVRNDSSTEGHYGIVQDQNDILGTTEIKEGDVDVQSYVHPEVSQGEFSATNTRVHEGEGVDTRVQAEAVIDSREPEEESGDLECDDKLDTEDEDELCEVVGESLNDTTERVVEIEETTEDIGEQPDPGQELKSSNQENQNKVDTEDVVLKTLDVDKADQDVAGTDTVAVGTRDESELIKVDEGVSAVSVASQEGEDFFQPQVNSVTEPSESEAVQGRNLYGHIHDIFGKQQGKKCIDLCVTI